LPNETTGCSKSFKKTTAMQLETITTIEKEQIPFLELIYHDVLNHPDYINRRKHILYDAMILGNNYHTKVKIIFECKQGIFQVETTVWTATEDFVLLKGGVYLPVMCIHDVIIA